MSEDIGAGDCVLAVTQEDGSRIDTKSPNDEIKDLASRPDNRVCADCDNEFPLWASVNNGVFICTACSGVHRSLGVEHSFVQSVTMDTWTVENVQLMLQFSSNVSANENMWEFHVPASFPKPTQNSSRERREQYINAKYKTRTFTPQNAPEVIPLKPIYEKYEPSAPKSSSIGEVEFVGVLNLLVKSCKDLINADTIGVSDPYVVCMLGRQTMKTRVIDNNLNPVWNQSLMLSWDGRSPLCLNVIDKDYFKTDDPIGEVIVDLASLDLVNRAEHKMGPLEMDLKLDKVPHGRIQFALELQIFR